MNNASLIMLNKNVVIIFQTTGYDYITVQLFVDFYYLL